MLVGKKEIQPSLIVLPQKNTLFLAIVSSNTTSALLPLIYTHIWQIIEILVFLIKRLICYTALMCRKMRLRHFRGYEVAILRKEG